MTRFGLRVTIASMDATRGDSRPSAQRLLVWPVVAGSFLFTAIYAALYALLVVRLRLLAPRVPTSDFIVPGFFAVLFGWVVISPRAACLPAKRDDSRFTLVLLVSIIAAVPALFALHYVRESMSRVARVADPAAILTTPPERYYEIATFDIDRAACGVARKTNVRGRNGTELLLSAAYACPFAGQPSPARIWVGKEATRTISNSMIAQGDEQRQKIDEFFAATQTRFVTRGLGEVRSFRRLAGEDTRDDLLAAIRRSPAAST